MVVLQDKESHIPLSLPVWLYNQKPKATSSEIQPRLSRVLISAQTTYGESAVALGQRAPATYSRHWGKYNPALQLPVGNCTHVLSEFIIFPPNSNFPTVFQFLLLHHYHKPVTQSRAVRSFSISPILLLFLKIKLYIFQVNNMMILCIYMYT